MSKSPPHIFLALPPSAVPMISQGECSLITSKALECPPTAANDDPPHTYRSALAEVREMKAQIRRKQAEDIPFEQRIRLFKVWKKLLKLEEKWQRRLLE